MSLARPGEAAYDTARRELWKALDEWVVAPKRQRMEDEGPPPDTL